MGVWNWRVLWENSADVPPEQVWVVQQGSRVELVVVENNWSLVSQTSAESLGHEDDQVEVCEPASDVEVLDWELSNDGQTKETSELSSGGVVSQFQSDFDTGLTMMSSYLFLGNQDWRMSRSFCALSVQEGSHSSMLCSDKPKQTRSLS